jgi:hypothetical protein
MIIILGIRSYVRTLAVLRLACRNGHVAAHRVVKMTRRFSLFFVPLFPVGSSRYLSVCSQCGLQVPWDKASAEEAARGGLMEGGAADVDFLAPSADPVAPPLRPVSPTTSLPAPIAAAGWYPDPAGESGFRYWDGAAWTEAVQEGPVAGA